MLPFGVRLVPGVRSFGHFSFPLLEVSFENPSLCFRCFLDLGLSPFESVRGFCRRWCPLALAKFRGASVEPQSSSERGRIEAEVHFGFLRFKVGTELI